MIGRLAARFAPVLWLTVTSGSSAGAVQACGSPMAAPPPESGAGTAESLDPGSRTSACAGREEIERLAREVAELHQRLDRIERELGAAALQPILDSPAAALWMNPHPEGAELRQRFEQEAVTPLRAAGMEADIRRTLEGIGMAGTRLKEISCRTSVCRVELGFPDEMSRDRVLSQFLFSLDWVERATTQTAPTTPFDVTVLIAGKPVVTQPSGASDQPFSERP